MSLAVIILELNNASPTLTVTAAGLPDYIKPGAHDGFALSFSTILRTTAHPIDAIFFDLELVTPVTPAGKLVASTPRIFGYGAFRLLNF